MVPIITLLTDFGLDDTFIGQMRGVILGICPQAQIVDLTHQVPPQDVANGAWQLAQAWSAFPSGTIHVAVVDPGVGSDRRPLAAAIAGHHFIAPDNGLLAAVAQLHRPTAVHHISNPQLMRPTVSQTFHGRDIFAPVAAHLAAGRDLAAVGPSISDWQQLPHAECEHTTGGLRGTVVHIDHFGNCVTCIPATQLPSTYRVSVDGRAIRCAACYSDVPTGMPVALVSSSGHLEIAINQGHAADQLQIRPGTRVDVSRA